MVVMMAMDLGPDLDSSVLEEESSERAWRVRMLATRSRALGLRGRSTNCLCVTEHRDRDEIDQLADGPERRFCLCVSEHAHTHLTARALLSTKVFNRP